MLDLWNDSYFGSPSIFMVFFLKKLVRSLTCPDYYLEVSVGAAMVFDFYSYSMSNGFDTSSFYLEILNKDWRGSVKITLF